MRPFFCYTVGVMVCPYCLTATEFGYGHLYTCEELNRRIMTVGKRGRLSQPLHALTHTGDEERICNCEICIEKKSK